MYTRFTGENMEEVEITGGYKVSKIDSDITKNFGTFTLKDFHTETKKYSKDDSDNIF
jgi:hypothetical protein